MNYILMEDFVKAYTWMFGGSKKEAEKVYKEKLAAGSGRYISEVINCFKNNARRCAYDD